VRRLRVDGGWLRVDGGWLRVDGRRII